MIRRRISAVRPLVVFVLVIGLFAPATVGLGVAPAGAQGSCPEGQILAPDGVTCGIAVAECPAGMVIGADGATCVSTDPPPDEGDAQPNPDEPQDGEPQEGEPQGGEAQEGEGDDPGQGGEGDESNEGGELECPDGEQITDGKCEPLPPRCPDGYALNSRDQCYEILDPNHPCVSAGRVPGGVTSNSALSAYTFLPGTGECLLNSDFRARVANYEAAADDEKLALAGLQATTLEVIAVEESLSGLEAELQDVRRLMLQAEAEYRLAEIRRDASAKELLAVQKELAKQREVFEHEAVEVYMGGGQQESVTEVLLTTDNANDFEATIDYAQAVLDDQRMTIESIVELESLTVQLVLDLEAAIASAEAATRRIGEVKTEFEELRFEQLQLLQQKEEKRLDEAEQIASIRENKSEFARELGTFVSASRDIEQILREAAGEGVYTGGNMTPPLDPLIPGSPFGPRLHPILGYVRQHDGLDMSGDSGAPISAAADGIVVVAASQGGYGNTVVIDHGSDLATLYAHQSKVLVEVGDIVEAGDLIGLVGSTGMSTGPHLHWEVRLQGTPVDPMPYLVGATGTVTDADADDEAQADDVDDDEAEDNSAGDADATDEAERDDAAFSQRATRRGDSSADDAATDPDTPDDGNEPGGERTPG